MDAFILDHTLRTILLGTSFLGIVSGALGCFALLRKQSLLGDAISHTALPGIAIAFLLTHTKHSLILLIGALIAGWIATLVINFIINNTTLKSDAALGIVLSVFFGFGLVLLTYIQKLPVASQSGLSTFLFGNATTLLQSDVLTIFYLGLAALVLLLLFWKELKVFTFDRDFATAIGLPSVRLELLLTSLLVISIVIGLQTVGVVLMSALIIAPGAAARQWTDRFSHMIIIAAFIGSLSGVLGATTSSMLPHLPTGPTIVVFVTLCVLLSLLFAPNRGILWGKLRNIKHQKNIRAQTMLTNLLLYSESATDPYHLHDISALRAIGKSANLRTMKTLEKKGWVTNPKDNFWGLTPAGLKKALSLKQTLENTNGIT